MKQLKYLHLAPELQEIADAPDHIRARHIFTDRFVDYDRVQDLLNDVQFLMDQPPQSRAAGLVIMGEPGNGKTKIAHAIMRRTASAVRKAGGAQELAVVMITMTGARDARTIFNRLLEALGAPNVSSMRVADREQLVLHLLRAARTRLVIIDEMQDVLSSTSRQQSAALDTVKLLMNELAMPILALGIPSAAQAMQGDPHLNARFEYKALPLWADDEAARALLCTLESVIPLRKRSDLGSPAMAKVIVKKSGGVLARMIRLINRAAVFAIMSGKERIDIAMLEEAEKRVPPAYVFKDPDEPQRRADVAIEEAS